MIDGAKRARDSPATRGLCTNCRNVRTMARVRWPSAVALRLPCDGGGHARLPLHSTGALLPGTQAASRTKRWPSSSACTRAPSPVNLVWCNASLASSILCEHKYDLGSERGDSNTWRTRSAMEVGRTRSTRDPRRSWPAVWCPAQRRRRLPLFWPDAAPAKPGAARLLAGRAGACTGTGSRLAW